MEKINREIEYLKDLIKECIILIHLSYDINLIRDLELKIFNYKMDIRIKEHKLRNYK